MMPRISRDYLDRFGPIIQALGQLASSKVYVVPPPPVYNTIYEAVVNGLIEANGEKLVSNLVFKGRSLFSYGWIGNSLNQHESREGYWTQQGLKAIKKFLVECSGLAVRPA